ncbi:MAG: DMT family transporter [archaeon]
MLWLLFASFTAFFESMKDVFSKKSLGGARNVDEYVAAWSFRFFALVFLLPLLLFIDIPPIGDGFFYALIVSGSLNVVTTILYMKAIKASDLSITMPMVTFTPLFLLVTSPLIVGEFPGVFGILGVMMIVLGSYTLNIKRRHEGFFEPFRALLSLRGPRLMLLVAFIWSISANFDKIGIMNSSPIFWAIVVDGFIAALMFPVMILLSHNWTGQVKKNFRTLVPLGFFSSLGLAFQMTAISLTLVVYVIAVKRMSALLSVVMGALFFGDKNVRDSLAGAVIMIVGVVLIALF